MYQMTIGANSKYLNNLEKRRIWFRLLTAIRCNSLQLTAAHCNTLQHTATHLVQTFDKILILCSASLHKNHNQKQKTIILTFETTYLEPFGGAAKEF